MLSKEVQVRVQAQIGGSEGPHGRVKDACLKLCISSTICSPLYHRADCKRDFEDTMLCNGSGRARRNDAPLSTEFARAARRLVI